MTRTSIRYMPYNRKCTCLRQRFFLFAWSFTRSKFSIRSKAFSEVLISTRQQFIKGRLNLSCRLWMSQTIGPVFAKISTVKITQLLQRGESFRPHRKDFVITSEVPGRLLRWRVSGNFSMKTRIKSYLHVFERVSSIQPRLKLIMFWMQRSQKKSILGFYGIDREYFFKLLFIVTVSSD